MCVCVCDNLNFTEYHFICSFFLPYNITTRTKYFFFFAPQNRYVEQEYYDQLLFFWLPCQLNMFPFGFSILSASCPNAWAAKKASFLRFRLIDFTPKTKANNITNSLAYWITSCDAHIIYPPSPPEKPLLSINWLPFTHSIAASKRSQFFSDGKNRMPEKCVSHTEPHNADATGRPHSFVWPTLFCLVLLMRKLHIWSLGPLRLYDGRWRSLLLLFAAFRKNSNKKCRRRKVKPNAIQFIVRLWHVLYLRFAWDIQMLCVFIVHNFGHTIQFDVMLLSWAHHDSNDTRTHPRKWNAIRIVCREFSCYFI